MVDVLSVNEYKVDTPMIVINRVEALGNGLINGFLFWLYFTPFFHVDNLDPILLTGDPPRRKETYRAYPGVHVLVGIHLNPKNPDLSLE